jgi:HK97 family phage major capsid protein/HK97 family phage prohead protease
MSKKHIPQGLQRHLTSGRAERSLFVERQSIDETARTATLAFASETPYERYWGIEILDCTASAMRTGRLRSGANLLCDHDSTDVVGVVESVEIGSDRVGRAVVRFGKSARAEEVWQDVRDGIRRNVSVGYMIHKAVLVETTDGVETYRVTDWEPFEISLVSVPADASVGVGRSAAPAQADKGLCVTVNVEVEVEDPEDDAAEDATEPPEPAEATTGTEAAATASLTPASRSNPPQGKIMTEIVTPEVRNHAAEISKVAATIPGGAEMAMSAIQRGLTVEAFQREALEKLASAPVPTSDIGLTKKEAQRFSILKVARYLANPDAAAAREAAFEIECSSAVAQKMGRSAQGVFMPSDVQKRDLVVGTPTAGGNLVATDLLAGSFIDLLRNAMVIDRLGTRMLTGLVGNVAIPKQTGGSTIYWVAENTAPTESQQTVGQVLMSPKTAGGFTDIGRTLMNQSSIDVENFVLADLAANLGLGIQQAAINGTGASNQPSGLLTRITSSVIGGTNGLAPTWQNIIDLETAVATANADVGNMAYLVNAKVRGKLKSTQKFTGTNGMPVWDSGTSPLNGYNAAVTNAVPSNLTKGTSVGVCSAILFGNFSDLMIGMWGTTDLIRDPYTASSSGGVRIVALQDVDVNVRNVESFATMVDALTV